MMAGRGSENKWRSTQKNCLSRAANYENADREKHKATCWHVRIIGGCHKTEHKKTNPVSAHGQKPDGNETHTSPTQLASHKNME